MGLAKISTTGGPPSPLEPPQMFPAMSHGLGAILEAARIVWTSRGDLPRHAGRSQWPTAWSLDIPEAFTSLLGLDP